MWRRIRKAEGASQRCGAFFCVKLAYVENLFFLCHVFKTKKNMEWYAVPPYKNEGWKIFNEKGELVATFENKDECLLVVKTMNQVNQEHGVKSDKSLYPWDTAPDDAMWATTHLNGKIEWWRGKPTWDRYSWGTHSEVRYLFIQFGGKHRVPDCRNSLEKRPS